MNISCGAQMLLFHSTSKLNQLWSRFVYLIVRYIKVQLDYKFVVWFNNYTDLNIRNEKRDAHYHNHP